MGSRERHASSEPGGDPVRLNEAQLAFVRYRGPAILHAPVGTGKTLALAERAAEAIRAGTNPARILCLTFTNRAASEMRARIRIRCGHAAREVVVKTFHGFATWLLRSEAKVPGLPADFMIVDEQDSMGLLELILRRYSQQANPRQYPSLPMKPRQLYDFLQTKKAEVASAPLRGGTTPAGAFLDSLTDPVRRWAASYQRELWNSHALDFGDLILYARWLLEADPDIQSRWERAFEMIQVDEMQDTHFSEYRMVRVLGRLHGDVALAGDFDQTIYEWRGSTPDRVLEQFVRDFPETRTFTFTENHRSTRRLLAVAAAVVAAYSDRPPPRPAHAALEGEPVRIHMAPDSEGEAQWIARQILELVNEIDEPRPLSRIGVLARVNDRGTEISRALEALQIPHVTVERFEFFRRQEVKDAVAHLRFLLYPFDDASLRRILLRPPKGVGDRTLAAIGGARDSGLRLVDLVAPRTLEEGDPFGRLLNEWSAGSLAVFDTETTGVQVGRDEVVELAAVRLERGRPAERFHRYLRNRVPVGDSVRIHGLDDRFLEEHGEDPASVFRQFQRFAAGSLLVGHNVGFDVRMVASHARRLGLDFDHAEYADTYEMARRFLPGHRLALGDLVERLGLEARATHRAMDDVEATCALLEYLVPRVAEGRDARRQVVGQVGELFRPLAEEIGRWRQQVGRLRPAELLKMLLDESGLEAYYVREDEQARTGRRAANLHQLVRTLARRDDSELDPLSALEEALTFAALARNVDQLDSDDDLVRILTVHQAKGLEFDTVFVAGLSEDEFPHYRALREGNELEELRVFYVAITRPRRRLFLTGHREYNGRQRAPSRLLTLVRGQR